MHAIHDRQMVFMLNFGLPSSLLIEAYSFTLIMASRLSINKFIKVSRRGINSVYRCARHQWLLQCGKIVLLLKRRTSIRNSADGGGIRLAEIDEFALVYRRPLMLRWDLRFCLPRLGCRVRGLMCVTGCGLAFDDGGNGKYLLNLFFGGLAITVEVSNYIPWSVPALTCWRRVSSQDLLRLLQSHLDPRAPF